MRAIRRLGSVAAALLIGGVGIAAAPLAAVAAPDAGNIVISEVESDGGTPGDWIEFQNIGTESVDLAGYHVRDDQDRDQYTFPAGTIVAPGAFLVIDQLDKAGNGQFDFGLGRADTVRLVDTDGVTVLDQFAWTAHGNPTWARDTTGAWRETAESTKGAANIFPEDIPVEETPGALILNEIDSQPADWIEFVNPGTEALDISGYEIRDNSDDHRWRFPAGSSIAAGEYLVVDAKAEGLIWDQLTDNWVPNTFEAAIGIGGADSIRVYDLTGTIIQETSWTAHAAIDGDQAAATIARCPDTTGAFEIAYITKGAVNECVPPKVVINEVESNGDDTDWVEIKNIGDTPVDISGWTVMDNHPVGHAADVTPVATGTTLAPGAYYVFLGNADFAFGLGANDQATVRDAHGQTVAEYAWTTHAAGVYARCPDGTGEFIDVEISTRGAENTCGNPVVINEVESSGGTPGDWIELYNPSANSLDIGGLIVKDNDDSHAYVIPAGTSIPALGYYVIEEADLGFGLGANDSVRVFSGETLLQETTWSGHAATTWGRCPDATGDFAVTAESTKGALNTCVGDIAVQPWPGNDDVRPVDTTPTFLADTSGLDFTVEGEQGILWVVDNGTGTIWKLNVAADGSFAVADGWADGKRVRFQRDAGNPTAAGPDAEGITVAGDGMLYIAAERDNSNKGANQNTVLMVDPNAGMNARSASTDLVALQEWDLTTILPQVAANTGVETIEWVSDAVLAGQLWDDNTAAPYDPANYPGHGDGLFLLGVENNGQVYAFALGEDGSANIVGVIDPKLGGVMALDYDSVLGVLWAVCDDGCLGQSAQITFNGTDAPAVAHFARPASMPNVNNEGFATSTLCVDGLRPVWWTEDGVTANALRTASIACVVTPVPPVEEPGDDTGTDAPGTDAGENAAAAPAVKPSTVPGLAQTGADDLTWILVVGGVLVLAGVVLFFVRGRRTSEAEPVDAGESTN
ncbi:LPXTG cell wall anchor domain-containing protein [Gulosibacter macacae]|uniref:LPXTG cell wall anchor domain-containing protein n=1 Tax=Gulosibacter macacae TaxID=2488791 RepID=A0A3P3W2J8_9MICO|nr:lamin tail domain-containing protein [Gulosibacter macacae]RRJ87053.1 LPXTG cell wall anchor domain-containing protein [Gulosibacter macacae]